MGLKLGENILEVYLGDIKTENEVQRKIVFILVGKHTKPLEGLFGIFIIAENDPVKDGDEAIEDAVGDEGLPDALVYAARPEEEDPVEAEARRLQVVKVSDGHCGKPRTDLFLHSFRRSPHLDLVDLFALWLVLSLSF